MNKQGIIDIRLFSGILVLVFLISLAVIGFAANIYQNFDIIKVSGQAGLIALLTTAGMVWLMRQTLPQLLSAAGSLSSVDINNQQVHGKGESDITIKLLELMALGDRYGNAFSIALVSVDHLQSVEQHYGLQAKQLVFKQVYSTLADTIRMPDRVGHYEPDRFLLVLPETGIAGATKIAERLRQAVNQMEIPINQRIKLQLTVSVGITTYRRGEDLQSLTSRAENTIREAENQGFNRVLTDLAA